MLRLHRAQDRAEFDAGGIFAGKISGASRLLTQALIREAKTILREVLAAVCGWRKRGKRLCFKASTLEDSDKPVRSIT